MTLRYKNNSKGLLTTTPTFIQYPTKRKDSEETLAVNTGPKERSGTPVSQHRAVGPFLPSLFSSNLLTTCAGAPVRSVCLHATTATADIYDADTDAGIPGCHRVLCVVSLFLFLFARFASGCRRAVFVSGFGAGFHLSLICMYQSFFCNCVAAIVSWIFTRREEERRL